MNKKHYNEFLNYFRHLKNAASIISGDFYKQKKATEIEEIEKTINQITSNYSALFKNLFHEIEENLYCIKKKDREIFVTSILKDFSQKSPYLNYDVDKKYIRENGKQKVKINNQIFPISVDAVHKLIIREKLLNPHQNNDALTIPEKYVMWCFRAYSGFFDRLDALCVDFEIDLKEVQLKKGIIILGMEENTQSEKGEKIKSTPRENAQSGQLKMKQIALIHVYNEQPITMENAHEIAANYGFNAKTSGNKLYQNFNLFYTSADRKGKPNPFSRKKLENKIELFESIIEHITDKGKERANDEIRILKTYLESDLE